MQPIPDNKTGYSLALLSGVLVFIASLSSFYAGRRSVEVGGTVLASDGCPICDCSRAVVALPGAVSAVAQ
jgi:hypothetical protein